MTKVDCTQKERKTQSVPSKTKKKKHVPQSYWVGKLIKISNRFAPLTGNKDIEIENVSLTIQIKSSPIFISGVQNIKLFLKLLDTEAKNEYTMKLMKKNQVKNQP